MDSLYFQEGIPLGYTPAFDGGIFYEKKHIYLQAENGWHELVCLDESRKLIIGLIYIHIENKVAKSPYKSPYGSFIFWNGISESQIISFIHFTEHYLKERGVTNFYLKNPPVEHNRILLKTLNKELVKLKYNVELKEMSSIIPVAHLEFEKVISESERKRLRKCRKSGFKFKQLTLESFSLCYQKLLEFKSQKGYPLSMSYKELRLTIEAFPDLFLITAVEVDSRVVACNISIIVNKYTLYNFYHDHDGEFDRLSPIVMLNEGLYQFCQLNNFQFFDLGTSTLGGEPNEGLLTFKKRLGAIQSPKYSFSKVLS